MPLASYQRVRQMAETPRDTERRLIAQITAEMAAAWDSGVRGGALMPALHRNREMWSTFGAACGAVGNALPDAVRAQIISIGLWVDRFTSEVVAGRESIDALLGVNRDLLDGLAPPSRATA
jgi:flagellar biosynthesis activator protein FlaF